MITPWDDSFIPWTLLPFFSLHFILLDSRCCLLSLLHSTFTHSFFAHQVRKMKKKKNMSEVWFSDSSKFSSLVLYFSYFVFFYPYLLKLISFLSPLFITTSLLLLLTFLFTPQFHPHFNLNFIFLAYERGKDQLSHPFEEKEDEEELEAFRVIFGASDLYDHIELNSLPEDEERVVEVVTEDTTYVKPALEQENKMKLELESFTKEPDELVVGKVVQDEKEDANLRKSPPPISRVKAISQRFEAKLDNERGGGGGEFSPSPRTMSNLGSCGSIRRDKEWKRTLACKLFEERHNNSTQGRKSEGMDLLWETYDDESTKQSQGSSKKNSCRSSVKEEDPDEDEDMGGDQLCCLQALKFSGGKMNLGMKKPSLVKISKAIKGIRWLHHLTTTTTSTKGKKGRI